MRLLTGLVIAVLAAETGCATAPAPNDRREVTRARDDVAHDADYVPQDHPCETDADCDSGQYCGTIGVGTVPREGPAPVRDERRYCLRHGSGDCCPPSAPPAR